jgi:hypothetical protein
MAHPLLQRFHHLSPTNLNILFSYRIAVFHFPKIILVVTQQIYMTVKLLRIVNLIDSYFVPATQLKPI